MRVRIWLVPGIAAAVWAAAGCPLLPEGMVRAAGPAEDNVAEGNAFSSKRFNACTHYAYAGYGSIEGTE